MKAPGRYTRRSRLFAGAFCLLSLSPIIPQDAQHPASGCLEAKLRWGVDTGHTKVGEGFQAETLSEWIIAGCTIPQGGRIYGKVIAATQHTKSSPESTLGFLIEGVDCQGSHSRSAFALHLLEIMVPDLPSVPLHSVLPTGNGGMTSDPMAHDDNTAADDETSSIRVGAVLGENKLKLEIAAGPEFADMLHSDKETVRLLSGTRLVLGTKDMIPGDMQLHLHPAGQEP